MHGEPHRRAPLAVHLRTWATVHASTCELSHRRGGRECRVAASTSAHAALLRLLARQPRLRPAPDPRLPWASRSQAHRSLHTRRRRTSRGFGVESGRFHAEGDQTFTVLERWAFLSIFDRCCL